MHCRTPFALSLCLACVLATAGCTTTTKGNATRGSADSSGQGATSTPVTAEQLQKAVLQLSDLPSGWSATEPTGDAGDDANNDEFLSCMGAKDTSADVIATAKSQDFSDASTGTAITSSASSYKARADIETDVATLQNPRSSQCLANVLDRQIKAEQSSSEGAPVVKYTLKPGSSGGPSNVVAIGDATVELSEDGQQVTVYFSSVLIASNQVEAEINFVSPQAPATQQLIESTTAAMAGRIAKL